MAKRKEWFIAFSLANLMLMREWITSFLAPEDAYFGRTNDLLFFFSVLFILAMLTLLFRLFLNFANSRKSNLAISYTYGVLILTLFIPFHILRTFGNISVEFPFLSYAHFLGNWGPMLNLLKASALCAAILTLFFKKAEIIILIFRNGLAALSIWGLFNLLNLGVQIQKDTFKPNREVATYNPELGRVLWIVFDEMDEHYSTVGRPPTVSLPNFDRLRNESLVSTKAFSPSKYTSTSLPSYIEGELLRDAKPQGRNTLAMYACDEKVPKPWRAETSIFSKVRSLGGRSALVGWDHPYCRILKNGLDSCFALPYYQKRLEPTLLANVNSLLHRPFQKPIAEVAAHHFRHKTLLKEAMRILPDSSLNLTLLHLPVPHFPGISENPNFSYPKSPVTEDYFNNLMIADGAFGEIRKSLEDSGLWDKTTVLVTSDHWWREVPKEGLSWEKTTVPHFNVPYIVHFPNQKNQVVYDKEFNTVLLHSFILDVVRGTINTPNSAKAWLDQYRSNYVRLSDNPKTGQPVWACTKK